MRIRVKLFATLGRYHEGTLPGTPFEVELPDGAVLTDLVEHLELPANEVKVIFVNGRTRANDWQLRSGDEVGIFPPVGGG